MFFLKAFEKEYMSTVSGIKPVTFQSHGSTVRSSTVSASGKLQLHVSRHRKLQSLHRSLPTGLFSPRHCPVSLQHTTRLCVSDKHWCPVSHIRSVTAAGICVLFIHNGSHSSQRRSTNICKESSPIITCRYKYFLTVWCLCLFMLTKTKIQTGETEGETRYTLKTTPPVLYLEC